MKRYTHLSLVERAQVEILHSKGYSSRDIGKVLGRNSGTVCRELKRKVNGEYVARKAHHKAYVKRKYSKYQGILSDNSSTPNVIMHEVCVFFNLCKFIHLNLFRMNK